MHREARLLGTGRRVQRAQTRLDGRDRRLPERRRRLHRMHDAWLPRQVHAVHERAAGRGDLHLRRPHVRAYGARPPELHEICARERAIVAPDLTSMTNDPTKLVEMSWDPITRIVGSLGIHTKIDFA